MRVRAVGDLHASRQAQEELEPVDRPIRPDGHDCVDHGALERSLVRQVDVDRELRLANDACRLRGAGRTAPQRLRAPAGVGQGRRPARRRRATRSRSRGLAVRVTRAAPRDVLGARRRNRLEHLADDVLGRDALNPELGSKDEAVCERGHRDRLDVVGQDVVAAGEGGSAARELEERQASARLAPTAVLGDSRVADTRSTQYSCTLGATCTRSMATCMVRKRVAIDDRPENDVVGLALDATGEHVDLAVAARIAERGAQEEAIELCLWERIRALVLDRVLRVAITRKGGSRACVTPSIVT